jgi:RNA polymerase sigma-70 factor (sigma-E family)
VVRLDPEVADALDAYVRARGHRLLRTAYLLTGDTQIAEDLVQNALASVLASWRRLPDVDNLDAYVYTALVNARRRWWSRRWHGEIPTEQLPDVSTSEDQTARFDRHEDMLALLGTLPLRQRQALVLRYFEDLTEAQTAQILGCSIGTVKSQTARGLDKMRAALAAQKRRDTVVASGFDATATLPGGRAREAR